MGTHTASVPTLSQSAAAAAPPVDGECEKKEKACEKKAKDSYERYLCGEHWKFCIKSKCKVQESGSIKYCPNDADCEAFCTEYATSDGGLQDCCQNDPWRGNTCRKRIDVRCSPSATSPESGLSQAKPVEQFDPDLMNSQPLSQWKNPTWSQPSGAYPIPDPGFAPPLRLDAFPQEQFQNMPHITYETNPGTALTFNKDSVQSFDSSYAQINDYTMSLGDNGKTGSTFTSPGGNLPSANAFNAPAGSLAQNPTVPGGEITGSIHPGTQPPVWGGEPGSTFGAPSYEPQPQPNLFQRSWSWFKSFF